MQGRGRGNVILLGVSVLDCRLNITLGGRCALQAESRVGAKAAQGLKQCRGTNVEDHMEITHWPRGVQEEGRKQSLRYILPATREVKPMLFYFLSRCDHL